MIDIRIDTATKCNGDWSLYVTFPYEQKIVDTVRTYPNRFWNKDTKEWELPFKCFKPFIDALPDQNFDIHGNWKAFEPKETITMPPVGFTFKTTPSISYGSSSLICASVSIRSIISAAL